MTMGPEPMSRILCRSLRRGICGNFLVVVCARDFVVLHLMADPPVSKRYFYLCITVEPLPYDRITPQLVMPQVIPKSWRRSWFRLQLASKGSSRMLKFRGTSSIR